MQLLYTERTVKNLLMRNRFYHNVGNLDISKILTENLSVAFGSEFRYETLKYIEGELVL
jgi:hypothetical protein